ncbi:MAG: glyoxylate/hydroxypyruvate reductase A [Acetobacter fabarum]|jgi:glyoxylate/hydroxypyruvate reductase A|uniref:2-hydroxyacid dehydrogenase n=1 Tax=Acetobacter fabarum TaxID=483199 RepID=UPI00242A486B|nr:glyoxylate/hydroxypyruvate reductase A [Acetobacter fabarum]MCH4026529.1 glyoxylate/hydroxypyruvate reductase A [Acetobacter fabarum]MCH4085610.1 glyoxylate/hydroxypyruvate reductase A [Acetobacter fabarum]MCH4137148.1 glyoxylate/hydroxypyruvate reductase A [Acetobacter fabarum]MCI1322050.1 glyoxylate/hydroxypyruvate reductase A [Acetobacter fabarum]
MSFLLKSTRERAEVWKPLFQKALPDLAFHIWPETGNPEDVRFMAAWEPPADLLQRFPNLEVLFSVGAGVDQFDMSAIPEHVTIIRMIEPGLTDGMVDYVLWATLTLHREILTYLAQQKQHVWKTRHNKIASQRRVGVMGLGTLGTPVARALAHAGFNCRGWSRSRHAVPDVTCYAGGEELDAFLAETDILVCLLPLTDATRGMLNADLFAKLPKGAQVINVARGAHLVTQDLLAALDSGQIGAAILDVTDPEPLPAESPLWAHPNVLVTPHVASNSQTETAGRVLLDTVQRYLAGERDFPSKVDRSKGY